MSQACFPDPARSRALLIGASHFTVAGPDLPDIPAVQANLTALRQALTNPDTGVLKSESCRLLADPATVDEVGTALSELAATATDLLLIYYTGHGLVDDRGRLHLALAHTHPHRARWTAFPLELLREEIANSAAATRVLILDCCFSGRAIEAMADDQGVIGGQLEVAGTYTLTSTTANAPSHAPNGDRYTAFTGALLRALDDADPLTLDQIFLAVDRDLVAQNLPRPQRRAVNTAGNLALSHGPTTQSHTEPPDSDTVHFTGAPSAKHVLLWVLRVVFGGLFWFVLRPGFYLCSSVFLLLVLGKIISSEVEPAIEPTVKFASGLDYTDGEMIMAVIVLAILALFLIVTFIRILAWHLLPRLGSLLRWLTVSSFRGFCRFVSNRKKVHVRRLAVDRSGLTIRRKGTRTHLPWRDIAQIGVLQPESGMLNLSLSATQYERAHILAVRLRPEIHAPSVESILSDEHRQLGYLGLCTVESLGSSPQEMTSALERFAGGKLVHSSRQFLDRDPRLRPEMV